MTPSLLFTDFDLKDTPNHQLFHVTPSLFRTPHTAYASGNKLKRKEHLDSIRRNLDGTTMNDLAPDTGGSLNVLAESCSIASDEKLLSLLSSSTSHKHNQSLFNGSHDEYDAMISRISAIGKDEDDEDDEENGGNLGNRSLMFGDISMLNTSSVSPPKHTLEAARQLTAMMMSPQVSTNPNQNSSGASFTPFFQYLGDFSGGVPLDLLSSVNKDSDNGLMDVLTSARKTRSSQNNGVVVNSVIAKRKFDDFHDDDDEDNDENHRISSFAERIEAVANERTISSPARKQSLSIR
jgi:hypothetical protein